MNWSGYLREFLILAAAGLVIGLIVGFVLVATDGVDTPFLYGGYGILGGSIAAVTRAAKWETRD